MIALNHIRWIWAFQGLFLIICFSCKKIPTERPNILLILADDMGFSDLSCYGSEINTPNIDELADNGLRFTQFYNTARCCPSRASLLTGLHPHQTGLGGMTGSKTEYPGYRGEISNHCVTLAEVLKSAGYKTYMTGKWHLTDYGDGTDCHNWPKQRGFDYFYGTLNGGGSFFHPHNLLSDNDIIEPDKGFYYTDHIGDSTSQNLMDHFQSGNKSPFFFYVGFTAPHFPLHAPDSTIQKYSGQYTDGWDVLRSQRYERMKSMKILHDQHPLSIRDSEIPAWLNEENKAWEERRMEVYAAQIDHMDQAVGKITNTLKELGQLDNTLILFLSDNGGNAEKISMGWYNFIVRLTGSSHTSDGDSLLVSNTPNVMPGAENTYQSVGKSWANLQNTPYRKYKHFTTEGGIITPLIIHWPEVLQNKGGFIREPSYLPDIMATLVDVSGASYPEYYKDYDILPMEGVSLQALMRENKNLAFRQLYWEHQGNKAIRENNWKLVDIGKDKQWALYDLSDDPVEEKDVAFLFPEIVERLSRDWEKWAWRTNVYPSKEKH